MNKNDERSSDSCTYSSEKEEGEFGAFSSGPLGDVVSELSLLSIGESALLV